MSAVFVSATGTDVGKTFVTAGLIRHLRRTRQPVAALKPVVTGFDPDTPRQRDSSRLRKNMRLPRGR